MPHSGTKNIDPIGTIVSKIDEVNRTIENRNLQAQNMYREINDTIELLHGKAAHMWRVILQLRYLDHAGWNEINFSIFGGKDDYSDKEESYIEKSIHIP